MKQRRLEEQWKSYCKAVYPPVATMPPAQLADLRMAFYAGASAIYFVMMLTLSDGHEVTSEDLEIMRDLRAEMDEFNEAVRSGKA